MEKKNLCVAFSTQKSRAGMPALLHQAAATSSDLALCQVEGWRISVSVCFSLCFS